MPSHTPITLILLQSLFLVSFAQLTFPSSYISIPGSGITFYFEFDDTAQILRMGLDMDLGVDYFAVGFADEGNYAMSTFDIVAFIFIPNNDTNNTYTTQVQDLYSTKTGHPPTDLQLGGTADYILTDAYVVEGKRQVLFQRAYNTNDKYDYIYDPTKMKTSIVMNWAFGDSGKYSLYNHHAYAGTVISQMYNGFQGTAQSYFPGGLSPQVVLAVHGYLMLFAWGILVEIVLQIGRYMKHMKFFVSIHLALATLLYLATAVMTGLALYIRWGEVSGSIPLAHFYIGFVIVGLCTIQVIVGLVLGAKMASAKVTKAIPATNKIHLVLGILIYLLTKAQIGIGLNLFKPQFMVYLYAYYALIVIFRVGQEYSYLVRARLGGKSKKNYIQGPGSQVGKHKQLLELLNNNTPVAEILETVELKGLKWAILDDKVFEIKDFTHPGGNFILNQIQGREIGRFIYGAYSLESITQSTQHTHSNQALLVIQRNLIGKIECDQQMILPVDMRLQNNMNPHLSIERMPGSLHQRLLADNKKERGKWILDAKTQINSLKTQFSFTCGDYWVNPLAQDIRNLGKHVKVSHISQKKIRLYSLVLSQSETRKRRRDALWSNYQHHENSLIPLANPLQADSLPLIIKRYDRTYTKNTNSTDSAPTFSSFLHNCPVETTGFNIEGPFGLGLGLTPESTGLHYIFAAGTGILPFLDLFDLLLESLLDPNSTTNLFKGGFKLHVYVGFGDISDFVGLDICMKLAEACKHSGIHVKDAFRLTIRVRDAVSNDLYTVTREVFDNVFVENYVDRMCEKVYVCGPPVFNRQIPMALGLIGIEKSRIVLV